MKKLLYITLALGLVGLVWWFAQNTTSLQSSFITTKHSVEPASGAKIIAGTSSFYFKNIEGFAVDSQGNYYVLDLNGYREVKLDPTGKYLAQF